MVEAKRLIFGIPQVSGTTILEELGHCHHVQQKSCLPTPLRHEVSVSIVSVEEFSTWMMKPTIGEGLLT